jgi:phosphohistidine phosphatase
MEMLLIRHGPAANRNPRKWPDDAERPLTKSGVAATRRAFKGLARVHPPIQRVISSPAVRARETAEILRDELHLNAEVTFWDELAPDRPAGAILSRLNGNRRTDGVAFVGHEPTLGELIGVALTGDASPVVRLSKAGAAEIIFPGRAVPAGGQLAWLLTRKQMAEIGRR